MKCVQRILLLASYGSELRRPHADSLRDGIHELRFRLKKVQYRILYFFNGKNVAVLSHGITKNQSEVPKKEIDKATKHLENVQSKPAKHIAVWEP